MVGCGVLILSIAVIGTWLRLRGKLYHKRWFHRALIAGMPLGWVAILAGWVVTEAGRQPYVVYGLLRTADAASPVGAGVTAFTLSLFLITYSAIMAAFLWYWITMVLKGPDDLPDAPKASRAMTVLAIASREPDQPNTRWKSS